MEEALGNMRQGVGKSNALIIHLETGQGQEELVCNLLLHITAMQKGTKLLICLKEYIRQITIKKLQEVIVYVQFCLIAISAVAQPQTQDLDMLRTLKYCST